MRVRHKAYSDRRWRIRHEQLALYCARFDVGLGLLCSSATSLNSWLVGRFTIGDGVARVHGLNNNHTGFSSGLACHFMSAGKHASLTVALHKVRGREGLVTRLSQVI